MAVSHDLTPLSAQQLRIINRLRESPQAPTPMQLLVMALWGDRHDGGPDDPELVVRVQIHRMRAKLAQYGITILTIGSGPGAQGYMIDPQTIGLVDDAIKASSELAIQRARQRFAVVNAAASR